jgi:L-arabinokinase
MAPGAAGVTALFYISGHGFGHAARMTQVIEAFARRTPSARIIIRSAVPRWFLDTSLTCPFALLPGDTDTGVVQPDSLSIDEAETARRAAAFYGTFDARAAAEADIVRGCGARIVVADIPPVAFAAAHRAGVVSVAIGNFTWDWIYGGFEAFDAGAPGVRATIAAANATASRTWRLPFHGGFDGMPRVEDVPLVARRASVSRDEVRRRLQLGDHRPVVLATFGGHGGNVPLQDAAVDGSFLAVATDYEVPPGEPPHPNLRIVTAEELRSQQLSYTDLLGACDVVATKLGYGIVSECVANAVPLLYTTRGRFVEQDVFIREMPPFLRCRAIGREALRAGRWADDVHALLAQPAPPAQLRTDGAEVLGELLARGL